jgi:hypothetical protein
VPSPREDTVHRLSLPCSRGKVREGVVLPVVRKCPGAAWGNRIENRAVPSWLAEPDTVTYKTVQRYDTPAIATILKALGFGVNAVASALKAIGAGISDIVGAIKNLFSLGVDAVVSLLEAIGFGVCEVLAFFGLPTPFC